MKKFLALILSCILPLGSMPAVLAEGTDLLPGELPFHSVIETDNIDDIGYGVVFDNDGAFCADIDSGDLKEWLTVYWDFYYDRVIAPLSAYELSGNYVKLWNSDKSKSYTVYSNGGVIVGTYGNPCSSHGETKQNFVWYLPRISNSRGALSSADFKLSRTYFHQIAEVEFKDGRKRQPTAADKPEIPSENLLITDNASDWAKPEIDKAAACNLMVYDLSENYTRPITRLEFCTLLRRLVVTEFRPNADSRFDVALVMSEILAEKGIFSAETDKFSDCSYTEVNTLAAAGIVSGMGDGTFAPDAYLTREQAASILYRTAEFLGNKTLLTADLSYGDTDEISEWARSCVAGVTAMGVMSGIYEDSFAPQWPYTVEQAIATVLRLYNIG